MTTFLKFLAIGLACLTGPALAAQILIFEGREPFLWTVAVAILASAVLISTDDEYVDGEVEIAATIAALGFPITILVLAWRLTRAVVVEVLSWFGYYDEPEPEPEPPPAQAASIPWVDGEPPRDGKWYFVTYRFDGQILPSAAQWVESQGIYVDDLDSGFNSNGPILRHCPVAIEVTQ